MGSPTRSLPQVPHASDPLPQIPPSPPAGQSSASGRWFLFQHLPPTGSPSGSSPGSGHQGGGPAFQFQFRLPTPTLPSFIYNPSDKTHPLLSGSLPSAHWSAPYLPGSLDLRDGFLLRPPPGYLSTSTLLLSMTPCLLTFLPTLTSTYFPSLLPPHSCPLAAHLQLTTVPFQFFCFLPPSF